jgi:hypothetical protein
MIRQLFLQAIQHPEPLAAGALGKQRKAYKSIDEFFMKEASREQQTLRYGDKVFTFWLAGIRPINFVVEYNGERVSVGLVAD